MNSNRTKQVFLGVFLLLIAAAILYLTFQTPTETIKLSEPVRKWVTQKGWNLTAHQVRSNAHIIEYFALGVILAAFFKALGKGAAPALIIGFLFGTADECLRIFLPTREFDAFDLMRDYAGMAVGIAAALGVTFIFGKIRSLSGKPETENDRNADRTCL